LKPGGVAIAVPNSWAVHNPETYANEVYEALSLIVFPPFYEPIKVASLYNHPGNMVPDSFFEKFDAMRYNNKKMKGFTISDLNCANEAFGSRTTSVQGKMLLQQIIDLDMVLINDESLTYSSNSTGEPNLLDLALCETDYVSSIESFYIGDDIGSDHVPVHVSFSTPTQYGSSGHAPFKRKIMNWALFSRLLIDKSDVIQASANQLKTTDDIDKFFQHYQDVITVAKSKCTYERKFMGRNNHKFSKETDSMTKTCRVLNNKKKCPNLTSEERKLVCMLYNKANKKVKQLIRDEEQIQLENSARNVANEASGKKMETCQILYGFWKWQNLQ
jgi:hypothetical protein